MRTSLAQRGTQLHANGVNQLLAFQPLVFVPWKFNDKQHNATIGHQAKLIRIAAGKRLREASIDLGMSINRVSKHEIGKIRWTSEMVDKFNSVFEKWVKND